MREKLIELLEDRHSEASEVCGSMNKGVGAWYADYLIANGVTIPVRCKDCKHWQKDQVKQNDGTYRDYRPDEVDVFGLPGVTLEVGINIGSHCTFHGCKDSSPTWFWSRPDDFCSYGERRTE